MKGQYRYPGTQAFQSSDAAVFYGRNKDVQQLMRLLRLEQMLILHGKSGLGKTSLINAGVLPLLQQEGPKLEAENEEETIAGFSVEEIRFGAYQAGKGEAPLDILKSQLQGEAWHPLLKPFVEEKGSLWLACKNHQLQQTNKGSLLLIFDQFEELFSYPASAIQHFKEELAALIHTSVPSELRKAVREQDAEKSPKLSATERHHLLKPLSIKVLLTIRSDRLSLLDQFTSHLPNMLVNLYELKPLNRVQAKEAIVEPARQEGATFSTAPFGFSDTALGAMLNGLSNDQGEIESFQLQLLCQYLENKVLTQPSLKTIKETDFGGEAGIQDILHNYYEHQLADLSPEDRLIARQFIEEGLIVNESRVAVAAGAEETRFGVGPDLLEQLLASRLIRAENIHLGKIYELSHDTLVEPVRRSLLKRQAEEERIRIEQELAAERKRLVKAQEARRRNRLIALTGFSLFALAAIAGVFALLKFKEAEVARKKAEQNERRATASALAARAWEIYNYDHTLAARVAEAALKIDSNNQEVIQTLGRIINEPNSSFYQKVLDAHAFHINQAAFSPDGQFIATASHDEKVILWDREGNILHELLGSLSGEDKPGHTGTVFDVAFSQDGKELLSVGRDKMLKVWSTENGELLREWEAHSQPVKAIERIPNSDYYVTAGIDQLAIIWDSKGNKIKTLSGHQAGLTDIAASWDGQYILSTSSDGTARVWNIQGQLIRTLRNEGVAINAGSFSPDGQYIALANSNKTAEIWTFEGTKLRALGGHKGQVVDISFFPEDPFILTSSEDATAKVWTLEGEEILTLYGHRKRLSFAQVAPDAKTIITGGYDFTAKLWDVDFNLDIQRHRHRDFIYGVDISDDDERIVTASKDFSAKVWNMEGNWLADLSGHSNMVQTAFFIRGREEIITASRDGTARIWNYAGEELLKLPHGAELSFARATTNRERIISSTADGRIFVWNSAGDLVKEWSATVPGKPVSSVDINPAQTQILSSQGQSIKLWNWEGDLLDSFGMENGAVIYRAFYNKNGDGIYTAAQEYPIREWSLDGQVRQKFYGNSEVCYWLAVHPEKDLVASASWDQTLKIWDTQGNILQTIPHTNGIYTVDFNSDASLVVTGSHDNIGRLWGMDGVLIAALGERVNPLKTMQSNYISPLSEIPLSVTEENIPDSYLTVLAGENPAQYLHEAEISAELGQRNEYSLAEKLAYFEKAIDYYQKAKELRSDDDTDVNSGQIAEVYRLQSEQLIIHRRFQDALEIIQKGIEYEELDYLIVLQTLTHLYAGEFEAAAELVRKNKARLVPQIEWYETYPEAIENEIAYFADQFGITHPDSEKLLELLKE